MHANSRFLQVFIWERFFVIVAKPMEFPAVVTEEVTLSGRLKKDERIRHIQPLSVEVAKHKATC